MNTKISAELILILCLGLVEVPSFAHEVIVHRNITEHAAASALSGSVGYRSFVADVAVDIAYEDVIFYLSEGSATEDDVDQDNGGKRSYNHFYDPLRDPLKGRGLSDFPPDTRIPPMGQDSFTWASQRNCLAINVYSIPAIANVGKYNEWSWQNARDYEWLGLTGPNKSDRFQ